MMTRRFRHAVYNELTVAGGHYIFDTHWDNSIRNFPPVCGDAVGRSKMTRWMQQASCLIGGDRQTSLPQACRDATYKMAILE